MTENDSTKDPKRCKEYVDYAAAMGFDYYLADGGWPGTVDIPELVRYAEQKGVKIWIWEHSAAIRSREIGFIFQNYNLIDSYTVLENVMVTYIIDGYSYKEAKVKAKEKLKLVGLENDSHKKAIKLSGGQKQRLAIARVLAKETNIIVADEPTGNLDVENGNQVLSILKELSKDKLVIVVTHNQGQVEPFVTRKIRLRDGEITSDEEVVQVEEEAEMEVSEYSGIIEDYS